MAKKEVKEKKNKTSFFKGLRAELKKVVWPTPKQLFNSTVAVLAIVLITALIVFVLDVSFEAINKQWIDRVKNLVVNTTTNENTTEENATSEESNSTDENTTSEDTNNTTDENKASENNATNENKEADNSTEKNNTTTENLSKK